MEPPTNPPHPVPDGQPERRLTSREFEALIHRAMELQSASRDAEEGISEAEAIRIGGELGLSPVHIRRAITDIRGRPEPERGALAGLIGSARVRVVRTVHYSAAAVSRAVEEFLVHSEYMVVRRRFPDRTRYVRDASIAATLGRTVKNLSSRHKRLDLKELDIAVFEIEKETALVELTVDLGTARAGLAAGAILGGGGGAAGVGVAVWAASVAPPLALIGLPVLAGAMLGARGIYRSVAGSTREKLEAFLDRLEHGELNARSASVGQKRRLKSW